MAHTYSKLFSQIVASTIWAEDHPTRIVWITLLALKDKFGEVNGTPVGIARIANVTLAECNAALEKFKNPEPSRHDDGRRIEEIDHGWLILNHDKYKRLASKEDSIEKNAERQRRFKKKHGVTVTKANGSVTEANVEVTPNRDISDTDTDTDTDTEEEKNTPNCVVACATAGVDQAFRLFNDACQRTGWPKAQRISDDRKKKMLGRIKDAGGIDGIAVAIGKAEASQFLTETWKGFSIDWLLKPANFTKLMEGNYDGKSTNGNRGVGSAATGAVQTPRGHGAFYDGLAEWARKDRD